MDYYHISAQELGKGAKLPILKLGDSGEVFYEMAAEMCAAIRTNNAAGKPPSLSARWDRWGSTPSSCGWSTGSSSP